MTRRFGRIPHRRSLGFALASWRILLSGFGLSASQLVLVDPLAVSEPRADH